MKQFVYKNYKLYSEKFAYKENINCIQKYKKV